MHNPRIPPFGQARVLVAGDVMLDRYWHGPTGRISPEAPVPVVRITELAYGAVIPSAWVNALLLLCVQYVQRTHCVSAADSSNQMIAAALGGVSLLIVLLDAGFNRQPYYASFHAVVGILFCWAWLLFSALYEMFGEPNILIQGKSH